MFGQDTAPQKGRVHTIIYENICQIIYYVIILKLRFHVYLWGNG